MREKTNRIKKINNIIFEFDRDNGFGHVWSMSRVNGLIVAFVTIMFAPDKTYFYLADNNLNGNGFSSYDQALYDAAKRYFHL